MLRGANDRGVAYVNVGILTNSRRAHLDQTGQAAGLHRSLWQSLMLEQQLEPFDVDAGAFETTFQSGFQIG